MNKQENDSPQTTRSGNFLKTICAQTAAAFHACSNRAILTPHATPGVAGQSMPTIFEGLGAKAGVGGAEARPLPRALSAERVYRPGRARAGQREGWVAAPPTAGCPAHRLCPRGPPPRVTLGGCTHTGWWITRPATSSSDPFCFLQGPVEVSTSQT